jgi:O-acetyl-ADP-ribose deacetylase (regulator of RNase III)
LPRRAEEAVDPRIEIVEGDITTMAVDAIVNAANTSLLGGGGVDGAIHWAAGPGLLEECRTLGGCPVGEARVTRGHDLPAAWVIHAVGPVWEGGGKDEDRQLASAYRSSLEAAAGVGARSVAFPLISTGVYRFPLAKACRIALSEMDEFLAVHDSIERVIVVCFGSNAYAVCSAVAEEL